MGMGAGLHAISQEFYEAALAGNINDEMLPPGEVIEFVDLESAWHAIHYLITGDLSLTFLLSGTQLKGVSEHCEVHAPQSMKALCDTLSQRSVADIMPNYDPAAFAKYAIYPNNWEASDATRARVERQLIQFLRLLRDVVGRNAGLLSVIC
jgi:hypothetical protein